MKKYTLFAGVNGAGKTSIYKLIYANNEDLGERINTDEMVARVGSWQDNNLQVRVAREAVKLIKYYLENNITFHQETTLAGKSILNNIKKAKSKGYYVVMNYIGVNNHDIAKERVHQRILKGGHGIPDEKIEKRYIQSFENLKHILDFCDEINIYDNSKELKQILYIKNGVLKWKNDILPEWIKSMNLNI